MSVGLILKDRKFSPLFWTQFLGALNDNILKNSLVVMATFKGLTVSGLSTASVVALAGGLFILPFFLFSPLSGQVADRLEKARLVRVTKIWELLIMMIAGAGFLLSSPVLLLIVLFLAGIQATVFGPVKYSLLPEIVSPEQLVAANASIELGTFLAILIGTIGGGLLIAIPGGEYWVTGCLLILATGGWITSRSVPRTAPADPRLQIRLNPIPVLAENLKIIRQSKAIFNSILGISWFWFFGATVLSMLPVYGKEYLGVGEHVVTAFLAMFTIGIGVGSILCERLSFGRVEIGLVPFGSLGMTLFLLDLVFIRPASPADPSHLLSLAEFWATPQGPRLLADFFLMALFGGSFILPLYSLIQHRSQSSTRSRVIAGNNILNSLFMVGASLLVMGFHAWHLTYSQIFLVLTVLNLFGTLYIYSVVPEFALRFLSWILARLLYRIQGTGFEFIPDSGPAVLVCNHVSYADWLIISALVRRPVRFVMYYRFFDVPILRPILRQAKVIPIAGARENPELLQAAFASISQELRSGEIVCIFPEGKLTKDGTIDSFRSGIEKILSQDPVPVVPMGLQGLWGTWFSREGGRALLKIPRHWLHPIHLNIGRPLAASEATASRLESEVHTLASHDSNPV